MYLYIGVTKMGVVRLENLGRARRLELGLRLELQLRLQLRFCWLFAHINRPLLLLLLD